MVIDSMSSDFDIPSTGEDNYLSDCSRSIAEEPICNERHTQMPAEPTCYRQSDSDQNFAPHDTIDIDRNSECGNSEHLPSYNL